MSDLHNALAIISEFVNNCDYEEYNDVIHDQLKDACRAILEVHQQEKTRVQLMHAGPQKIQVIKAIRQWSGLGLKEAKEITDIAGHHEAIIELPSKEHARDMLKAVKEAGGTMVLLDPKPDHRKLILMELHSIGDSLSNIVTLMERDE